jgi:hypothetical protein
MTARGVVKIRSRRAAAASLVAAVCLGISVPGSALAQQDLPDPNGGAAQRDDDAERNGSAQQNGGSAQGGLPQTGLFAVPVLAAGLGLLATGVVTRPARRRRRAYSCDTWWDTVTSGRR